MLTISLQGCVIHKIMKHINKASHNDMATKVRIVKDSLTLVEDNFLPVFFVTTVSDINIQTMNCPPFVSLVESEMAISMFNVHIHYGLTQRHQNIWVIVA